MLYPHSLLLVFSLGDDGIIFGLFCNCLSSIRVANPRDFLMLFTDFTMRNITSPVSFSFSIFSEHIEMRLSAEYCSKPMCFSWG